MTRISTGARGGVTDRPPAPGTRGNGLTRRGTLRLSEADLDRGCDSSRYLKCPTLNSDGLTAARQQQWRRLTVSAGQGRPSPVAT